MPDLRKTPLFSQHQAANARMVDFGGWALPVNYGSQIDEHKAVRKRCGMFDVSHMTVSDVRGAQCIEFLSYLLANDIHKVTHTPGKALYSCMLNPKGGVIDDLIVTFISEQHCRLVSNAGTHKKVMAWLQEQADQFQITIEEQPELALIAVQGPHALHKCAEVLTMEFTKIMRSLERFQGAFHGEQFVSRTGYTGEDGVELIVTADSANALWQSLLAAGVQPCGLGARDTLRLESGMSLYGNDLDEDYTPLESGLAWSVALKDERDFIGKSALFRPGEHKMIGLILQDRGVLRSKQAVFLDGHEIGKITSGTFSPSLKQSIALARVNTDQTPTIGKPLQIAVRNKFLNATLARYPFIKNGKATNSAP